MKIEVSGKHGGLRGKRGRGERERGERERREGRDGGTTKWKRSRKEKRENGR